MRQVDRFMGQVWWGHAESENNGLGNWANNGSDNGGSPRWRGGDLPRAPTSGPTAGSAAHTGRFGPACMYWDRQSGVYCTWATGSLGGAAAGLEGERRGGCGPGRSTLTPLSSTGDGARVGVRPFAPFRTSFHVARRHDDARGRLWCLYVALTAGVG